MRIEEVCIHPYSLPLVAPLCTAWGVLKQRQGWLVAIRDDTGGWGLGEAAPLPGFGMEPAMHCEAALNRFAQHALKTTLRPPLASSGASDRVARVAESLAPALGKLAGPALGTDSRPYPAARHAVEQALLDRLATRAGHQLAHWLCPQEAPGMNEIAANATLGADPPDTLAMVARHLTEAGYRTLKLKVAVADLATDLDRVQAVRQSVGPQILLRLDANGGWNIQQARQALKALAGLPGTPPGGIEYVEQPLAREQITALAALSQESPIPLAADESADSLGAARRLIHSRAARVIILKPMVLGGILPALTIADEATAAGLQVVVTTSLEGAIGRLGALHTAAARAKTLAGRACGLATGGWLAKDLLATFPQDGPRMRLPQQPGLGWVPQAKDRTSLPYSTVLGHNASATR